MRQIIFGICLMTALSLDAQTQSWQWVKTGGSQENGATADEAAECKIAGCDTRGNVYGLADINGTNFRFDTFSLPSSNPFAPGIKSYVLFSYDCSGNMRWARQITDSFGYTPSRPGVRADPQGNVYVTAQFIFGRGWNLLLGDTTINSAFSPQSYYVFIIKFDSMGHLVWYTKFNASNFYGQSYSYGLRIGSSGNIWIACHLGTFSPFLDSIFDASVLGNYQIEVTPDSGKVIGGYYTSNQNFGMDLENADAYYDLDAAENYYETGLLYENVSGISTADTLILAHQTIVADSSHTYTYPFLYSLDRTGNFRWILTNSAYNVSGKLGAFKYDPINNRIVMACGLDPLTVYAGDTFRYNPVNIGSQPSRGILGIDLTNANIWCRYITAATANLEFSFRGVPTPYYIDNVIWGGTAVYDNSDTISNDSSSTNYQRVVSQIDTGGHIKALYPAALGRIDTFHGFFDCIRYGATDWKGNQYLGGSITQYMVTPPDSIDINNTGYNNLGSFFIVKIGISDCSCPTPGVQFTQRVHGDSVTFYGTGVNTWDSIRWQLGDGSVMTADTFTYIYAHGGTFIVTATSYNGCGTDSLSKQISVVYGGIDTIGLKETKLYPNPAQSKIFIDVSAAAKIGLITANGATMWEHPVQVNQPGTYVFEMSRYAAALYYFIVEYSDGKTEVLPVVKQ